MCVCVCVFRDRLDESLLPPLLCSLEDPLVSDWWFQCACLRVCLCGFSLAVCSEPINSWPLTHTVNNHVEPSKFLAI